tara:strand:+ start:549 stop:713 length:165 start_codon:yes stop_codon:yes gene_type:complete
MNILQCFDRFVAIPQEPWRENLEKNAEMHFFGVSEVWKLTFSRGTTMPARIFAI